MEQKYKELREEFQKFADSIVWSNDDGSEKYIGVGNMADWWIKKIEGEKIKAVEDTCKLLKSIIAKEKNSVSKKHNAQWAYDDIYQRLSMLEQKPFLD